MTKRIVHLLLAASFMFALVGADVAGAPAASACDIADPFFLTPEHLAGDFNAPNSLLNRDYRDWKHDETATIEVTGVYVYESVYLIEGDDDWYAGSLSVPMQIWGEWPEDTAPEVIEPQRRNADGNDDCGSGPAGRPLGRRVYSVVTDEYVTIAMSEDAELVLNAAFGAPDTAPRDTDAENDLIAQIDAARRSTTRLFIGGGLAAIAIAGIVMYMSRRDPGAASGAETQAT